MSEVVPDDTPGDPFARYRNPDGTYNGVTMMAQLTGQSEEKIRWMWARMHVLIEKMNMSPRDAADVIVKEQKGQLWSGTKKNT